MTSESGGWLILVAAGLTEVVWAVSMGMSDGFARIGYTALTAVFLALSTWLLSKALDRGLPVGAAYACWVGIGAVGTVAVSSVLGMEHLAPESLVFVAMVAVGVVGLQATGKGHAGSRSRFHSETAWGPAGLLSAGPDNLSDHTAVSAYPRRSP